MKLSPHFYLEEFTASQTAERLGLDNYPSTWIVAQLMYTAAQLEKARRILANNPVIVTSGYRSPALNAAVRGSQKSAHMEGLAADIICPSYGPPIVCAEALINAGLVFDQLIYEFTWLHIGFSRDTSRKEVLTARSGIYTHGLIA